MIMNINVVREIARIMGNIVGLSDLTCRPADTKLVGYCVFCRLAIGSRAAIGKIETRRVAIGSRVAIGKEGRVAKIHTIARSPNFQSHLDKIIQLLFGRTIFLLLEVEVDLFEPYGEKFFERSSFVSYVHLNEIQSRRRFFFKFLV